MKTKHPSPLNVHHHGWTIRWKDDKRLIGGWHLFVFRHEHDALACIRERHLDQYQEPCRLYTEEKGP